VASLHEWMREQFRSRGVKLDGIYSCPHHPEVGDQVYRRDCDCRKPKPGMILAAQRDLNLDLAKSALVGDRLNDMEAARSAGVSRRILFVAESANMPVGVGVVMEIASSLGEIRFLSRDIG